MKYVNAVARLVHRSLVAVAALALATVSTFAFADPPSRVVRLAVTTGSVSFSPAGDEQWVQARINRPLIAGDRLWADRDGRAELQFGSGAVRLDEYTAMTVMNLDDRVAQFHLAQGTMILRVRRFARNEIVEVATPNVAFRATAPGVYRIEVDPQGDTTTVLVRDGNGDVFGDNGRLDVVRGLAFRFYGQDVRDPDVWNLPARDDFERWAYERDRVFDRSVSLRYVSPDVVGYVDLDTYGTWQPMREYGHVWFPRSVPADWVPYREGHWSWVEPWGWTWVDDAPWGFAPFHYGRWAYFGTRWGWVPGPASVRPVYAPALVAFVGGPNFQLGITSGLNVGWFPLAPGEVYRPAYRVSRDYFREVNVSNTVVNTTVITNIYNNNMVVNNVTYRNVRAVPGAVTVVPAAVIAEARPVRQHALRVGPDEIRRAGTSHFAPVSPEAASFVGAAPAARSRPPQDVLQRRAVATLAPAPAPPSVEQRLPELRRQPGRPSTQPSAAPTATPAPGSPSQRAEPSRRARTVVPEVQVVNPGQVPAVQPSRATSATPPPANDARRGRDRSEALRAQEAPSPASPAGAGPATPTPQAGPSPSETRRGRADERAARGSPGAPPPPPPAGGPAAPSAPVAAVPPVSPPIAPRAGNGEERGRGEERRTRETPAAPAAGPSPAPPPAAAVPPAPSAAAPRAREGETRGRADARGEERRTREATTAPAASPAVPPAVQPPPSPPPVTSTPRSQAVSPPPAARQPQAAPPAPPLSSEAPRGVGRARGEQAGGGPPQVPRTLPQPVAPPPPAAPPAARQPVPPPAAAPPQLPPPAATPAPQGPPDEAPRRRGNADDDDKGEGRGRR